MINLQQDTNETVYLIAYFNPVSINHGDIKTILQHTRQSFIFYKMPCTAAFKPPDTYHTVRISGRLPEGVKFLMFNCGFDPSEAILCYGISNDDEQDQATCEAREEQVISLFGGRRRSEWHRENQNSEPVWGYRAIHRLAWTDD